MPDYSKDLQLYFRLAYSERKNQIAKLTSLSVFFCFSNYIYDIFHQAWAYNVIDWVSQKNEVSKDCCIEIISDAFTFWDVKILRLSFYKV